MNNVVLFSLYGRSGMWHYATQYANNLAEFKETMLVCPKYADKKVLSKKIIKNELGADINIFKFLLQTINIFQHIKSIYNIFKFKSKTIHFLDNHPWTIIYALFFKLFRKKIIITQHDPIQHTGEPRAFLQNIINKIQRIFANKIIVHGKFIKKQMFIQYKTPKNKIIVFPHGDYEFIKKYDSNKLIKTEKNTFLFFGRILKYKGIGILFDSLEQLNKLNKNFKLLIAGSGDLSEYKEKIKKYEKNLEIHNRYIDESEIPVFFKRSSFVVLPYLDATQTGIIPIAYAYKKPVLITNVGALPEVVENKKTGIIVKVNKKSIAEGINWLLNCKNIDKLGENAYEKMKNDLNWSKNIKNILFIYLN